LARNFSMLLGLFFLGFFLVFSPANFVAFGQSSSGWNQTYGGSASESCFSVLKADDGGYVMVGDTFSFGNGDADVWLVKTDEYGNLVWNRTFGTLGYEDSQDLIKTVDGGYLIVGRCNSFGAGDSDLWLIKTDSFGNMQWNKTIGGTGYDKAWKIVQTADGNYAFAGITDSFGSGGNDYWLLKTDYQGNVLWNTTIGGVGDDRARCLVNTLDGGFFLTGWSNSYGAGGLDFWLVKADSFGNPQWNMTFGGEGVERSSSLVSTVDGGCVVVGYTASFGEGETDFFVVKTDFEGNMQWNRTYGGSEADSAYKIIITNDGGYGVVGNTYSFGLGENDIWFIKIDENGDLVFDQTYGGEMSETSQCLLEDDNGYVIAGVTDSFGVGETDFWLIKTDKNGVIPEFSSSIVLTLFVVVSAVILFFRRYLRKQS